MSNLKKMLLGTMAMAMVLTVAIGPGIASASPDVVGGRSDLGDALVLDRLFSGGSLFGGLGGFGGQRLGDLFVLDQLFAGGGFGGRTNLGDVVILDQLFR